MPPAQLPAARLRPPALPTPHLERPQLGLQAACLRLEAGPGGGASQALAAWLRAQGEAGLPCAWLSLRAQDGPHLGAALAQALAPWPGLGPLEALAQSTEPAQAWAEVWALLAQGSGALALDGLQHLGAEGEAALAEALGDRPEGLRLGLASAQRPQAGPWARLAARGGLLLLGPEALNFSRQECETLAEALACPERAQAAWEATEGWPLGLTAWLSSPPKEAPQALAAMAHEAWWAVLSPEAQAWCLRLASFQGPFAAEVVAEAFGEGAPLALAELAQGFRLRDVGAGRYELPRPWARCAEAEAAKAPASERRAWLAAAAQATARLGPPEGAVPLWLKAEAWLEASRAAVLAFPAMRYSGREAELAAWLASFPPSWGQEDPWWQLWRGHSATRAGESPDAEAAYRRALAAFIQGGEGMGAFKAQVCLANLAVLRQDSGAFDHEVQAALAMGAEADDEDMADLHLIRAHSAEAQGDRHTMRALNEAVLGLPVEGRIGLAASHAIAAQNLATYWIQSGDLRKAREAAAKARAVAEAWGFGPMAQAATTLAVHVEALAGRLEGAEKLLKQLPAGWLEGLDWHDRGVALVVLAGVEALAGRLESAESQLREALTLFEGSNFLEGRKLALEGLARLALRRGLPARVRGWLAESPVPDHGSFYDHALALPVARAEALLGQPAEAAERLALAVAALEGTEARLHAAWGRLFLAEARALAGQHEGAQAAWAAARLALEHLDGAFLRHSDPEAWDAIHARFAPKQAASDGLQHLEAKPGPVLPSQGPAGPGAAAPSPAEPGLRLCLLGPFLAQRAGQAPAKWPRKKARRMLAALALHPQGLSAYDLAEYAGEGSSPTTLKVAIHALRQALAPDGGDWVRLEGERYRLCQEGLLCDHSSFEAALARAERAHDAASANAARREALALLAGPLLPEADFGPAFEAAREAFAQRAAQAALALLAEASLAEADPALKRALAALPGHDALAAAYVRAWAQSGQVEQARQAYWDARQARQAALALGPGPELEAAHQSLKA